ncbi:MAG: hypothetical protein WC055_16980, partial [Melioribacteraceae bacterium]
MSKKIDSKQFSLSYPELIQIAKNLSVVLTRDLTDLSIFGLTAPAILNLSTLTTDFENSRTDVEYEGDVMIKTDAKNVFSEQALEQIRFMNVRVEAAFGLNSVIYETFKFGNINEMPDKEILETLRRITRMANQYIAQLTAFGVNPALITSLEDLANDYSDAITEQEETMDARRLAASARIDNANEIYAFISNYSNFGKKFYANTNPAKYADYVIYDSSEPGTLTAPANLQYDQISGIISWNAVDNATSYKVEISYESGAFEEIYADVNTETYYIPPNSPSTFVIHAMARNASGLGPIAPLTVNYNPPVQPPGYLSLSITNPTLHTIGINW